MLYYYVDQKIKELARHKTNPKEPSTSLGFFSFMSSRQYRLVIAAASV